METAIKFDGNGVLTAASSKAKLFTKIALIQSQLDSIPETGYNEHFRYSYASVEDVINHIRPKCVAAGLAINVSIASYEILKEGKAALVVATLTLTDSESGESLSCSAPGYAEDSKGDKAMAKAITGATKYAIRSCFCIASGDDPDRDEAKSTVKTVSSPPAKNNPVPLSKGDSNPLIEQTTAELKRLGWTVPQGRLYLQENYNKTNRSELTETELRLFLEHLRSL